MQTSSSLIRWSGLAAMVGGVLWTASNIIHASKPRGCIADECAFRPMRESGILDGILFLLALLFFAVGAVALMIRARQAGRFGRLGSIGVVTAMTGVALLVIASLIQTIAFNGDFRLMPYFVIPGALALIVGFLLLGIAVLRAKVLPRWVALLLIIGSLTMLGFNEQNAQTLMAIPFGIAWTAVGYTLWSEGDAPARQPARVTR